MESAGVPDAKRRRLRCKTTIGQLVVAFVGAVVESQAVAEAAWNDSFLSSEALEQEDASRRKMIYLVTLAHCKHAVDGPQDLRALGANRHEEVVKILIDVFNHPDYVDAGAIARGAPRVKLMKMVVLQEFHAPDADGVSNAHYHIALSGSQPFYFAAYKRALRKRHHIASH